MTSSYDELLAAAGVRAALSGVVIDMDGSQPHEPLWWSSIANSYTHVGLEESNTA